MNRAAALGPDPASLGILLYETTTRKMPFQGTTSAAAMSAILHDTPEPIARLNFTLDRLNL